MPRLSRRRINACAQRARNAADGLERGRALEELVCLVFTSVPGILPPIRNVVDFADGGEIDVFLANKASKNGLWFLPISVLVESKNWRGRVGAEEVRVFIDRLRERACGAGILIAANGITGDPPSLEAAHRHVARALEQGIHLLVLTLDELEDLESGRDLIDLLLNKWTRLKTFLTSIE